MTRRAQVLIAILFTGACSSPGTTPPNSDGGGQDAASADAASVGDVSTDVDERPDTSVPDSASPDALTDSSGDAGADMPQGLRDEELLASLREQAMETQIPLGYTGARDAMYALGGIEDYGGRIEGIYTGRTVDTDGSRTPGGNCELADGTPTGCQFNTEHTMALYYLRLELGDPSDEFYAAEGDIHHLFPSYEVANTVRYHFGFGDTDCAAAGNCKFDELSQMGLPVGVEGDASCPQGDATGPSACVMMVRPQRRGDVARAQFYMSMRYGVPIDALNEAAMRRWNLADPPDPRERERNASAAAAQGNRNPFVDAPGLVDQIGDF